MSTIPQPISFLDSKQFRLVLLLRPEIITCLNVEKSVVFTPFYLVEFFSHC